MESKVGKIRTSIRLNVVSVCIIATVLTAALATGLQYYFGKALARQAATDLYTSVASGITEKLRGVGTVNANIIGLLAANPVLRDPQMESAQLEIFAAVLAKNPLYYGIYLGTADGGFFEVINLEVSRQARQELGAIDSDRWVVITIRKDQQGWERHYRYLNSDLQIRLSRSEPTDYDVRSRPWYTSALDSDKIQITDPYLFAQLGVPGRTLSTRLSDTGTVVAIDMTLATISQFLAEQEMANDVAIYLYQEDGKVIASNRDLKLDGVRTSNTPGSDFPAVPSQLMQEIARDPRSNEKILETAIEGETHLVYSAATSSLDGKPLYVGILSPLNSVVAPFLDKVKLSIAVTSGLLLLLLPLSWFIASPIVRPIKLLARENDKVRRREYSRVTHVRTQVKELDDLSDSLVSMVASIQTYEQAQRKLMDAIIQLIAEAIDDKSAYTGGHCERVPELAMLLAQQASDSEQSAFREFEIQTEDQWREYRISAWLHDCGKITTPEHIVDKGSKLEVIYNRIHEVRTRFEVLWRDAEIEYLRAIARSPGQAAALRETLEQKRKQLQDDFTFVADCNVGGEFLDPDKEDRLRQIAQITWWRHFDNRLGLSPVEELRNQGRAPELPAQEQLLADKPEHIIERTRSTEYPARLGIRMEIPEHLYNQGELYNLRVSRGTLTTEDRFRINEHMISTIKMLDRLPFPEELKNVPRFASTHHETMRGSGYPRKLPGEQLSMPERILAVADVYEALTASDRPYKKAKSVSESVKILHQMAVDKHIDRDCFELFLSSGVYLDYARRFLQPEQIDEVDVSAYLSST